MASFDTPDYVIGNSSVVQGQMITVLQTLDQALQALEPAPNATTVQFDNTILLQDPLVITDGLTLTPTSITATSSLTTTSNSGDITLTTPVDRLNLNALNILSYTYSMPICFTRERTDTFTYNFNGTGVPQTYEIVYSTTFSIPFEFVADSPTVGYNSTNWKIDFGLNTWSNTNLADKGIACYFVLEDQASNFYLPVTYNPNTPYAVYQPASTFQSQISSLDAFQNYNWSDYVDLNGLTGSGSGNLPLNLRLIFAGDSSFSCNFSMNVSLTRTNLV